MQTVEQRGERQPVMMATKGKLYGSKLDAVARVGGQCRALWNLLVAENMERYEAEGNSFSSSKCPPDDRS
jgi:hypothetical protein